MIIAQRAPLIFAGPAGKKLNKMAGCDLDIDNPRRRCTLAIQDKRLAKPQLVAIKVQRLLQVANHKGHMADTGNHGTALFHRVNRVDDRSFYSSAYVCGDCQIRQVNKGMTTCAKGIESNLFAESLFTAEALLKTVERSAIARLVKLNSSHFSLCHVS